VPDSNDPSPRSPSEKRLEWIHERGEIEDSPIERINELQSEKAELEYELAQFIAENVEADVTAGDVLEYVDRDSDHLRQFANLISNEHERVLKQIQ